MKIAITSQNLDPKIVVSGISTVVNTIITLGNDEYFLYEVGYRDGDKKDVKWFFKQIGVFFKYPFFLKKNQVDLVHLNVPFNPFGIIRDYLLLKISKLINKRKVLLHIHGGKLLMIPADNYVLKRMISYMLNNSDKVLVLSEIEKDILFKNYGFSNADYLENAVNTASITYSPFVKADRLNENKINILYLARITESKGIDDVIVAMQQLYTLNKNQFTFTLCGSGDNANTVADTFKSILGDDFNYKGAISGDEKWLTISQSDIFLLPSRHSEGLPMSLLETMAAGVIPIVTDEASMIKVVKNGVNGIVAEKYNGVELAHKISDLMSNPSLMEQYSSEARNTIVENYDTRNFVHKLHSINNLI